MGRQPGRGRRELDGGPAGRRGLGIRFGLGAGAVALACEPDGRRCRRNGPRADRGQDQAGVRKPQQAPCHGGTTSLLSEGVRRRRGRVEGPRLLAAEGRDGQCPAHGGEYPAAEVVHRCRCLREGCCRAGGVRLHRHLGTEPGADGYRHVEGRRQSLPGRGRRTPQADRRLQQGREPLQRAGPRGAQPRHSATLPSADVRRPRKIDHAGRAGTPRPGPRTAERCCGDRPQRRPRSPRQGP